MDVQKRKPPSAWLAIAVMALPITVAAQGSQSERAVHTYPSRAYWGDTHVHTNVSMDAYLLGNTTLGPADAYQFARGEIIRLSDGSQLKLDRPLDFLVVADHAENLGVMPALSAADPLLLRTSSGKRFAQRWSKISELRESNEASASALSWEFYREYFFGRITIGDKAFTKSVWQKQTALADQYNDPGKFTALIGFEWSSQQLDGPAMHRNVIFRDSAQLASQVLPFSQFDSQKPEDLWHWMESYERKTGGRVLAIPHKGDTSYGEMFAVRPMTRSNAERRQRWEPLYEITQVTGTSETHPLLSPTDEFASYELRKDRPSVAQLSAQEQFKRKQGEYARSALKNGLALQAEVGINPFKFGLVGSTDTHTSLAGVEENNFTGADASFMPGAKRLLRKGSWRLSSSGYVAVWATENTRAALFDAMKRKETYATTGTRITLRFFGGWNYQSSDATDSNRALIGYRNGVPMGGDITRAPPGKGPSFLVYAAKDVAGANLDRLQIIKGWRDAKGELHERVYDVAISDERTAAADRKIPAVGSTVDVHNATYTNSIGDPELAVVWHDPDFDREQLAFYYVRVLEIPTPRWTAYDAVAFGLKEIPAETPMLVQERAYSSPIWYTP